MYKWLLPLVLLLTFGVANANMQKVTGDIVFIIDESGSMAGDISAVKANAKAIFNYLKGQGDFKVGVVSFGGYGQNPRVVCPLTDNATEFEKCIDSITAGGGYQPGFDAVVLATNKSSVGLRGVASCMVLITDEDADKGVYTKTDAVNALNSVPAYFIGIFDPNFGSAQNDYGVPNGLAGLASAGGVQINLADFRADYNGTLKIILMNCTQAIQNVTTQCNDGIDNDGDGLIDYPNDPGCLSPQDNDEKDQTIAASEFPQFAVALVGLLGGIAVLARKRMR